MSGVSWSSNAAGGRPTPNPRVNESAREAHACNPTAEFTFGARMLTTLPTNCARRNLFDA